MLVVNSSMLNELEGENDGLWWPAMQLKVLAAAVRGLSVGPCVKTKNSADLTHVSHPS